MFYTLKADFTLSKLTRKFKPDIIISFGSPYAGHAAFLNNKPHIALDDTDTDLITYKAYSPFALYIITPDSFLLRKPKKQIRFPGNFELAYLHPNRFTPNPKIIDKLGLQPEESYCIVRFVGHSVVHDIFENGLSSTMKQQIVKELSKYVRVFVSSEIPLDPFLEKFRFPLPVYEMHNAMAFASLVFGESATMASEASVLGIPSVFLDSNGRCYTDVEEEKYGLVFRFDCNKEGLQKGLDKGVELLTTVGIKVQWQTKRKCLLDDSIDVTAFLVWFIENYPESVQIMKVNPDYQNRFKDVLI